MSYPRVMYFEQPATIPWAEGMKRFRKTAEPALKKFQKAKVLKNYSVVQTGDHTGLLIADFPNKAAMNKYLKTMAAIRNEGAEQTGMQYWIYHGPVKASG